MHPLVWGPAIVVAGAMLIPALYLVVAAADLRWERIVGILTDPETRRLTGRTLLLAATVTGASVVLGVPLAWLTTRSDLPARRVFAVATALPLVIPTYVGAYALVAALAPGGLVQIWFGFRPPSPYGFGGAFLALTLFTFPYVLITVQAALRGLDPSLEEASRSLGQGPVRTFFRVTLPQLRSAIAAGGLLVTLYVLSDFGAVSILRYSTFTRALYMQYRAAFDRAPAALLGLVLVALTVVFLVLEARAARDRGGQFRVRGAARSAPLVRLGRWRWPAIAVCVAVVALGLAIPITVIGYWLVRGLRAGEAANLALDRKVINDVACLGFCPPTAIIVPRVMDFALQTQPVAYDPAKAKQLLAEAGYPNGFATTLWVPESGSGMQSPVAMSTVIQSNLKAVGVNVTMQTMEWGAYLAKLRSKEQDLFALSWMAGNEDPDMVMYPLLHSSQWTPNGPNRALYKNARFDELLQQARLVTDQGKRAELYRQAQRLLLDDPPWIFIDHEVQIAAFSRRVQGFKLHPSFDLRVETISLR